jgi:hypothetical protein
MENFDNRLIRNPYNLEKKILDEMVNRVFDLKKEFGEHQAIVMVLNELGGLKAIRPEAERKKTYNAWVFQVKTAMREFKEKYKLDSKFAAKIAMRAIELEFQNGLNMAIAIAAEEQLDEGVDPSYEKRHVFDLRREQVKKMADRIKFGRLKKMLKPDSKKK